MDVRKRIVDSLCAVVMLASASALAAGTIPAGGGVHPIERTAGQVTSGRQCSGQRTRQVGHIPGWSAVGGSCTGP